MGGPGSSLASMSCASGAAPCLERERSSSPESALTEGKDVDELVRRLLGVRQLGRPPFLVRNLKYVHADRAAARGRVWDLRWAANAPAPDSPSPALRLTIAIRRAVLRRAYHRGRTPSGTLRLWLAAELPTGEYIAFGVRESTVNLILGTSANGPGALNGFHSNFDDEGDSETPQRHVFDLSAVIAFLKHTPARLSVVAELFVGGIAAVREGGHPLRSETCLVDTAESLSTAVPNRDLVLPLRRLSAQDARARRLRLGVPRDPDIEIVDATGDTLTRADVPLGSKAYQKLSDDSAGEGTLFLSITGALAPSSLKPSLNDNKAFCEHVLVRCEYTAPECSWWSGIVRHDFICPWCHRNCRRLRTLLTHFRVDHERARMSVEGMPGEGGIGAKPIVGFTLSFSVTPVPGFSDAASKTEADPSSRRSRRVRSTGRKNHIDDLSDCGDEDVHVNKERYPRYLQNGKRSFAGQFDAELDMRKCSVGGSEDNVGMTSGAESDATQFDDRPVLPKDYFLKDGWARCEHCNRPHQKLYTSNPNFCGEWCEIFAREKKKDELSVDTGHGDSSDSDLPPLSAHASAQRKTRINFEESLGNRTLYHVVSVSPMKETHFDEDDVDSEEEVDQSWRLRITEEKLHYLEGATAKERVLWIMWNRYSHENFPAPGNYAERYTRLSLEQFVFEYAHEIHRLRLRLPLIGLLSACHVHGSIDADAFKSVMLCLDGKKKRRQCAVSSRPEVLDPAYVPRSRKQSRSKKKATRRR